MTAPPCPICGRPTDPPQAPFCSRGCRDRDLLKWLGDGYVLPGGPSDPADEALDRLRDPD